MRIWDVPPENLCRQHLLGEHRELHGLWNILTIHEGKGGYSQHPETKRWVGKLSALRRRHERLVEVMLARGYQHHSHLDLDLATGPHEQDVRLEPIDQQYALLAEKGCPCQTLRLPLEP